MVLKPRRLHSSLYHYHETVWAWSGPERSVRSCHSTFAMIPIDLLCFNHHSVVLHLLQVIENLEGLENLKCLYLGKNKITKIQNLESLKMLETLSLQVGGTAVSCTYRTVRTRIDLSVSSVAVCMAGLCMSTKSAHFFCTFFVI